MTVDEVMRLPAAERLAEWRLRLARGEVTVNQVRAAENMNPVAEAE
jgi:hypothetical protein